MACNVYNVTGDPCFRRKIAAEQRSRLQMHLLKSMRCCAYFWFQSTRTEPRQVLNLPPPGRPWERLKCDRFKALAVAFPVNRSVCSRIFARKHDLAPPPQFGPGDAKCDFQVIQKGP